MIILIDNFLNKITMYRLVLYSLIFLWLCGLILSLFNQITFGPLELLFSLVVILSSCLGINKIFGFIYRAPSNTESSYITAFILSLVLGPESISWRSFLMLAAMGGLAIASKYIIAIHRKHLFNPAAFAMVAGFYLFNYYPSWWVGDASMIWFVIIVGLLITRKIQRFDLAISFLTVFIVTSLGQNVFSLQAPELLKNLFLYSSTLFFSFIMLTEPITSPPTRKLRIVYGALVGFLLAPFVHIGTFYFSPESALLAGNLFAYIVSPKLKLILALKEKIKVSASSYDFIFHPAKRIHFKPGQYMEWTLGHKSQDARGMRRYFTIASSPTEENLRLGVKFYEPASSYKKALFNLRAGDKVVASQLAGDFTLPQNSSKKLLFLAGGIGITPFRSMIKYLIDTNQKRDIVMLYAANSWQEVVYREIFDEAERTLGITTIYVLNTLEGVPGGVNAAVGPIHQNMIMEKVGDIKERLVYMSGPRAMIVSFEKNLSKLGIPKWNIKTDFFPGYT